jgi:ribonucleotide reductase beta subunit family protein with ferritin-like domain
MFLGPPLSIQRYDQPKYQKFMDLWRQQEDYRWMPDRYSLIKDRSDYEDLGEAERFVFETNLRWQTATDSLLSRSIHQIAEHITNPELELCIGVWSAMENIHSFSYTYILNNITKDMTKFFDSILEDEELLNRMVFIKSSYDEILKDEGDIKQKIFNAVLATQITEGLSFYVSFVCSFWFGYRGLLESCAKIVGEIARDEALHVSITQNIMKYWRECPEEGFQNTLKENEGRIYDVYGKAVDVEKGWADYLFSRGALLGLNAEIVKPYIEWLANNRLQSMGYKKIFDTKKNPLGNWIEPYFNSSVRQNAPQEVAIDQYLVDSGNTEIRDEDFEGLIL